MNSYWKRVIERLRGEQGVSLVELLIAITITGIIVVPLVGAIFFGFRTTNDTQTRLIESGKAGILNSFFVPDVDNAVTIQKNVSEPAASCGTPRTQPVNLLLTAADGSTVSYYRGSATIAGENTAYLYRKACAGGNVSAIPMINNLASTPTFNCRPTIDCVTQSWTSITGVVTQADTHGNYATTIQASKRVT